MNRLHDNPKASELPFPAEAKWISGGSLKPEGSVREAEECLAGADAIRAAFNRAFYRGGGLYAGGQPTALAAPLSFKGLCADGAEDDVASELVRRMRGIGHRACFGILGSKWIPRALSDHGFIDDAWRIFTQPEAPGFAAWTREYDTLWEILDTDREYPYSKNHIMFGDFSAWAYEYLAGIKIVEPGFAKVDVKPHLPEGVESFDIRHQSPRGEIRVVMKRGASPRWSVPESGSAALSTSATHRRCCLSSGDESANRWHERHNHGTTGDILPIMALISLYSWQNLALLI